jgi:hydroxymethylpyrimidine pyrophosphatase-like HAD family hydrolase
MCCITWTLGPPRASPHRPHWGMPNDVLMFAHSGLSIAMGNASHEVQRAARRVTTSNEEDGFANAVEQFIL